MTNSAQLQKLLNDKLVSAQHFLSETQTAQLFDYLLLLDKWNHTYNLTSVRVIEEMISLHILDSLSVVDYLTGRRIIDVGTGAGLPGIPLAIVQLEKEFVLLDSNGKKTRFLIHALQHLKLSNVTVVQERAERYRPVQLFDVVISRAFSSLQDFVQNTQHLCNAQGQLLAMKGQYPQAELAALGEEVKVIATHSLTVPELAAQRHLICLAKA